MKEMKAGKEVNIGKGMIEAGIFLLLLNLVIAALLWEAVSHHWQIIGEKAILEQAWIRQGQALSFDRFTWEACYLQLLHFLFGFLGNHQAVAVAANILLQLLGLFLFYRGSRRLTNGVISLVVTGILGIVSIYNFSVVMDTPGHLCWIAWGFGVWLLSFIRPVILSSRKRSMNRVQEAWPAAAEPEPLQTEEKSPVKLIPNPLPLPKKHVKKEMDYAFEPPKERMHYDLNNYNVNDDYDLKEV